MNAVPQQPSSLYELSFPSPALAETGAGSGPVLVHALEGFADAGHAISLTATHLRDSLESQVVATFNSDELIDYRSRRPVISFSGEEFTDVEMPSLTMHAVRDADGTGFLLLSGAEPDLRWEQFVEAVSRLAERFGVSQVVGLNAVPMAVPHTRPSTISAHGNDPESLGELSRWGTGMKLPASASMLLELRLGEQGYRTAGLSVHVPHYLSQSDYPAAAARLLQATGAVTGLNVPVAALENAAESMHRQIDAELEGNAEVSAVVAALENQYDSYFAAQEARSELLAGETKLPTGDELGAQFEQFLAEQADETDGEGDSL